MEYAFKYRGKERRISLNLPSLVDNKVGTVTVGLRPWGAIAVDLLFKNVDQWKTGMKVSTKGHENGLWEGKVVANGNLRVKVKVSTKEKVIDINMSAERDEVFLPLRENYLEVENLIADAEKAARDEIDAEVVNEERVRDLAPLQDHIDQGEIVLNFVRSKDDGWIEIYRDQSGNEFESPAVTQRSGRYATITAESYAAALDASQAKAEEEEERKAAWEEEKAAHKAKLLAVAIPPEAKALYEQKRAKLAQGFALEELFRDGIDHPDYWLLNQYLDAIELQEQESASNA